MKYEKECLQKQRGFVFPPPNLAFPVSPTESPSPLCTSCYLKSQLHSVLQRERRAGTSPPREDSVKPSRERKVAGRGRRPELFPLPDGAEAAAPPLAPHGEEPGCGTGLGGWGCRIQSRRSSVKRPVSSCRA